MNAWIRVVDERSMLEHLLDAQRQAIADSLHDLTDESARQRLVSSATTPLGLVKHVTFVGSGSTPG